MGHMTGSLGEASESNRSQFWCKPPQNQHLIFASIYPSIHNNALINSLVDAFGSYRSISYIAILLIPLSSDRRVQLQRRKQGVIF